MYSGPKTENVSSIYKTIMTIKLSVEMLVWVLRHRSLFGLNRVNRSSSVGTLLKDLTILKLTINDITALLNISMKWAEFLIYVG